MLNPNEAPEGLIAEIATAGCDGCALEGKDGCYSAHCYAGYRKDRSDVIFKLKQPKPDLTNAAVHAFSEDSYQHICCECKCIFVGNKNELLCNQCLSIKAPELAEVERINKRAKEIYSSWPESSRYPWIEGGNSLKQDEARALARTDLAAIKEGSQQVNEGKVVERDFSKYADKPTTVTISAELSEAYVKLFRATEEQKLPSAELRHAIAQVIRAGGGK